MEPKALVYRNWEELVFENRNKQYGAYVLRREYNDKVLAGFGISIALIAFLFFVTKVLTGKDPMDVVRQKETILTILPPPEVITIIPPARKITLPPQEQHTVVNHEAPPLVVTEPVEPIEETQAETPAFPNQDIPEGPVATGGLAMAGASVDVLPKTTDIFTVVEEMPYYVGGNKAMMKFLTRKLRYPRNVENMGVEGTVYVSFVVKGDGTLAEVEVVRGFHPDCDKEAVRVVSMLPDWVGGKQRGVPVGVRMVLPITFKLN